MGTIVSFIVSSTFLGSFSMDMPLTKFGCLTKTEVPLMVVFLVELSLFATRAFSKPLLFIFVFNLTY